MKTMPLVLIGVDFRRAPTRYRAALSMDEQQRENLISTLREHGAEGLVVLETCNRCEWMVASERAAWVGQLLAAHMIKLWQQAGLDGEMPTPYRFEGEEAVRHLFRVAAGLESFVLGERQIAGQLQRAFFAAREAKRSCSLLNVLGSWSGRVVRKLQRRGASGALSTGVQLLAWEAIEQRLGDRAKVGVVGMGEIGQWSAELFRQRGIDIVCFNRSAAGPGIRSLKELPQLVGDLDALVVASGASKPWLDRSFLASSEPLIIDLGSPGQVVPQAQFDGRYLDLDALLVGQRPVETRQAEALEDEVALGVAEFRLSQVRRGLRHVVELNHRTYEELAYRSLPQALDGLGEEEARQVEARMRGLLRRYSRAMLRAVEDSAEAI